AKRSASPANSQLLEVQVVDAADSITYNAHDADDALFLDMDCAILGASAEQYDRYVRQVRQEHVWAPGGAFRKGRLAFVSAQLDRPAIFHTEPYRQRFEAQARANLERERAALSR
ncbi:MAG: hypothetical protein CMH91_13620, partial [Oceanicaulis sp.]